MRVSGLVSRRFWTKKSNCKPARSTGQSCLKVIQSHKIVYRPKDLCREDPIYHQTEIKLELQNKKWRVRFHPSQGWDLKTSTQRSRNYQRSVAQTPKPAEPEEASVECRDPREPPEKDLKAPLLHRPDPLLTLRLRNQYPSPWPPQHHTEPAGVRGNLSAFFSIQHSCASSLLHKERLLLLTFCCFLLLHVYLGTVLLLFVLFSLVLQLFMLLTQLAPGHTLLCSSPASLMLPRPPSCTISLPFSLILTLSLYILTVIFQI